MATELNKILSKLWVLLSLLLLMFFLGFWNYSNFQSEKEQLRQNFEIELKLAYSEVIDSVLVQDLLVLTQINKFDTKVARNAFKMRDTNTTIYINGVEKELKFIDLKEQTDYRDSFKVVTYPEHLNIKLKHKLKRDSVKEVSGMLLQTEVVSNVVVRTNSTDDVSNYEAEVIEYLSSKGDHGETILEVFKDNLKGRRLPFSFIHINDTVSPGTEMRIVQTSNYPSSKDLQLDMKDYSSYLWKKIMPSLIFSVLLLGMVSLAFWSLLSNWSSQQKLIEVKNEFISNMTHELKTPISTVSVALEAISSFDLSKEEAKTKEYIEISRHEISRLSLLVDKVLKMASFESKDLIMNNTSIVLVSTIEDILDSMKLLFTQKKAQVTFEAISDELQIMGDKVHITNVIYNVIDNALKYSVLNPIINISLKEESNNVLLTITDNGKGIPKEYLDKVFDRFFRVPNQDRHNVKGHGLGLSYVKEVVEKHQGSILVENNLDQGASFILSFPKIKANV